ncbi:MAG: cyclic lactone autoinducer peptide [Bacilli bacterium]
MNKILKRELKKRIASVAVKNSVDSVNSCCFFLCHQPKLPLSVQKLKKQYGKKN